MSTIGQMSQSMNTGGPYGYGSPGGPQGVNTGGTPVGVVAPQQRATMMPIPAVRFGNAGGGTIGICFSVTETFALVEFHEFVIHKCSNFIVLINVY